MAKTVSSDTARLAKKKGYNIEYDPSLSDLQEWFRIVHNIYVCVVPYHDIGIAEWRFVYIIFDKEDYIKNYKCLNCSGEGMSHRSNPHDNFTTWNQALEKGLTEALENLKD